MTLRTVFTLAALFLAANCFAAPILQIREADGKRAAIQRPAPVYPPVARQLKLTGSVVVEATVTTSGTVSEVKPVTGNPVLIKPAIEAVKRWRFQPFTSDGLPAEAVVTLSFEFDNK